MKLLDTSIAIDHLRGHDGATSLLAHLVTSNDTPVASEVTRFELLAGVRDDERPQLEEFFLALDWAPVTEQITRCAGEYARAYRRSHSGIGVADYLIAATARVLNADLLTGNVRHFPMFDKLKPPYPPRG